MPDVKVRGRCAECRGSYALTSAGLVRRHHPVLYAPPCPGGGLPPVDDTAMAELAEARREIARLGRELAVVRAQLRAEQTRRQVAESHARASDAWRKVARVAMEAMTAEWGASDAVYEARVAEIHADSERRLAEVRERFPAAGS